MGTYPTILQRWIVQPKYIFRASSLGEDNFSFLTRHLTDTLQAENG